MVVKKGLLISVQIVAVFIVTTIEAVICVITALAPVGAGLVIWMGSTPPNTLPAYQDSVQYRAVFGEVWVACSLLIFVKRMLKRTSLLSARKEDTS